MLMKCSECGNDVSDKAEFCPRCGAPLNKRKVRYESKGLKIFVLLSSAILFPLCGALIAILWFLILCGVCASVDEKKVDKDWIRNFRNSVGIFALILAIINGVMVI